MNLVDAMEHRATDPEAMQVLFAELEALSRRLTPAALRAERPGIVNVALLKLIDAKVRASFLSDSEVRLYLITCFKNVCMDEFRARQRDLSLHVSLDAGPRHDGDAEAWLGAVERASIALADDRDVPGQAVYEAASDEERRHQRQVFEDAVEWFFREVLPGLVPSNAPAEEWVATLRALHDIALGKTTLDDVIAPELPPSPSDKETRKVKSRWYTNSMRRLRAVNSWLKQVDPRTLPAPIRVFERWIARLPLSSDRRVSSPRPGRL